MPPKSQSSRSLVRTASTKHNSVAECTTATSLYSSLPYSNMEEYVQYKRRQFDELETNVPRLKERVQQIRTEAQSLSGRSMIRKKQELMRQANQIEKEIANIENGVERKKFEIKIEPYLQAYRWHMIQARSRQLQQQKLLPSQQQQQQPHQPPLHNTLLRHLVPGKGTTTTANKRTNIQHRIRYQLPPLPQHVPRGGISSNSNSSRTSFAHSMENTNGATAAAAAPTTSGVNGHTNCAPAVGDHGTSATTTTIASRGVTTGGDGSDDALHTPPGKHQASMVMQSANEHYPTRVPLRGGISASTTTGNRNHPSTIASSDESTAAVAAALVGGDAVDTTIQPLDHEQQAAILFMECLSDMEEINPIIHLQWSDCCPGCDVLMILSMDGSEMTCPKCHYSFAHVEATTSSTGYNEQVEVSNFTYQRINHFNDWLKRISDRQSYRVPNEHIEAVMEYWYQEALRKGIRDIKQLELIFENITDGMIRKALTHLGLSKLNDYNTQIRSRISGIPAPHITPEQEEIFRTMFQACQKPFDKYANRYNFLSYSYTLYKFCQIQGWKHLLPCFPLLKGKDKLANHEDIFKNMCTDLEWPFIPIDKKTKPVNLIVKNLLTLIQSKSPR